MRKGSGRRPGVRVAAGALAISAAVVLLTSWVPRVTGDADPPRDLTFAGAALLGGTISISTTADRAGIVRAEASEVEFQFIPPSGSVVEATFSRTLYFQPPAPITDGHFEFRLPGSLAGMVRGALSIDGALLSDTEAAGTVTYVICMVGGCSNAAPVDWTAEGPVDTPPGPDDVAYYPTLEGSQGSLVFTMDPSGRGVTSLVLEDVSFEPCAPADSPLSMRMFFEPPAPLETGAEGLVELAQLSTGLHLIGFEGSRLDGGTLAGAVSLTEGPYGDCSATISWTTGTTPTPTSPAPAATPPPTPGASRLPAAGAGRAESSVLGLQTIAACLLSLAVVLGVGALWHRHRR